MGTTSEPFSRYHRLRTMRCRTANVCLALAFTCLLAAAQPSPPPAQRRATPTDQPPTISTASMPDGITLSGYRFELGVEHGASPYTWTITQGHLPDGMNLEPRTGLIAGTPLERTTNVFTVRVEDAQHRTATRRLEIRVADPLVIEPVPLPQMRLGEPS